MIIDTLSNLNRYVSLHSEFRKAVDFISQNDLVSLAIGKYELGNGSFVNVSEYETVNKINKAESHKKFIDIQVIVSGAETMVWQSIEKATLTEDYIAEKDVMFWECEEPSTKLKVYAGMFAIFFPEDLHQPNLCFADKSMKVKKVLFKIPL